MEGDVVYDVEAQFKSMENHLREAEEYVYYKCI